MPSVHPSTLRKIVPFLLLPAGIGLLYEAAIAPTAAQKIFALALAVFCPELTRMAWIDLKDIEALTTAKSLAKSSTAIAQPETTELSPEISPDLLQRSQQLNRFQAVVVSTIALEATGFYLTFVSLPLGAIVVVLSQFWFNLLADVQLYPAKAVPIVSCGIRGRQAVLVVNAITASLLCLWPIQAVRLGLATAFLGLVILFLALKYGFSKSE